MNLDKAECDSVIEFSRNVFTKFAEFSDKNIIFLKDYLNPPPPV